MEFFESREIKATRKDHNCSHCYLKIPKGSKCIAVAGKNNGDFFTQRAHVECEDEYKMLNIESECGEEWLPLSEMREVYPHNRFDWWQEKIRDKYSLGVESE